MQLVKNWSGGSGVSARLDLFESLHLLRISHGLRRGRINKMKLKKSKKKKNISRHLERLETEESKQPTWLAEAFWRQLSPAISELCDSSSLRIM